MDAKCKKNRQAYTVEDQRLKEFTEAQLTLHQCNSLQEKADEFQRNVNKKRKMAEEAIERHLARENDERKENEE